MSDIRWEDPPEPAQHHDPTLWVAVADELRAHPKRWAVIREESTDSKPADRLRTNLGQFGKRIKRGEIAAWSPPGSFETAVRHDKGAGMVRIYVRYVGEDTATSHNRPTED